MDTGKPRLVDHGVDPVETDESAELAEGGAVRCSDFRILSEGSGVGPVLADERTQVADTSKRGGLIDVDGVDDVTVKCGDDEEVADRAKRVQR